MTIATQNLADLSDAALNSLYAETNAKHSNKTLSQRIENEQARRRTVAQRQAAGAAHVEDQAEKARLKAGRARCHDFTAKARAHKANVLKGIDRFDKIVAEAGGILAECVAEGLAMRQAASAAMLVPLVGTYDISYTLQVAVLTRLGNAKFPLNGLIEDSAARSTAEMLRQCLDGLDGELAKNLAQVGPV